MYERSAIVLERFMEKILGINKEYNLKKNQENFRNLVNKIEEYQIAAEKEITVIKEFDETAKKIQELQKEQERLYKSNRKLEDDRAQLFCDLDEDSIILENKLKKIESALDKNNEQLKEIRENFTQYLSEFSEKQKERNKCEKARRLSEAKHIEYIKIITEDFEQIEANDIICIKDFVNADKEQIKKDALDVMIKNGKNEKVSFNQDVLEKSIVNRIDIAEKEAECYILTYDRTKKILAETDSELININKYKKVLRDTSAKLSFLSAMKEYIVGFLDYERMTAIAGTRTHKKMMEEACSNFDIDMLEIKNLYELILREVTGKVTKKAYKELYNKSYLRLIEAKEKSFEKEVNNVNISVGTVINSNYWRIDGIKNIYNIFQEEVTEKFNRDLSEFILEEDKKEKEEIKDEKEIEKPKIFIDDDDEYDDEYDNDEYEDDEYDDDEYDDDEYDDDEYDDDEYDDDKYDDDEYDDEYEDDEYEDDEYDDDEYEDDEYDDDEYDDDEYEDDEEDDEYEDNEEDDDEYEDDNIDTIIEKSRKKASKKEKKKQNKKKDDNKGLFKFFKN